MMGVDNWQHWAAWFIVFFISTLIVISFMTILFCSQVPVSGPRDVLSCAEGWVVVLRSGSRQEHSRQ